MRAISIITTDHRAVERQHERFAAAPPDRREEIARRIVHDLSVHSAMEEMRLYPAIRRHLGQSGVRYADHSLKEHQTVAKKLERIDEDIEKAHTKAFADRMETLMRAVVKHVEEEEQEILPKLEAAMSRSELAELGRELQDARKLAPTRPHPAAPKEGIAAVVANVMGKAVDSIRDRTGA